MADTMHHSTGGGRAGLLIGLLAVGGLALAATAGTAKAAPPAPGPDPCKDLNDAIATSLPTATAADLPHLNDLVAAATAAGCDPKVIQLVKNKIADLMKPSPGPSPSPAPAPAPKPPGDAVFNAADAPDPVRAHSLAWFIGNLHIPDAWASANPGCTTDAPSADGTTGTIATADCLARFMNGYPGNAGTIIALQQAAGLIADGKWGPQTQRAQDYFFGRSARPDGSSDVRPYAGMGHAETPAAPAVDPAAPPPTPKPAQVGAIALPSMFPANGFDGGPYGGQGWDGAGWGGRGASVWSAEHPMAAGQRMKVGTCAFGACGG